MTDLLFQLAHDRLIFGLVLGIVIGLVLAWVVFPALARAVALKRG